MAVYISNEESINHANEVVNLLQWILRTFLSFYCNKDIKQKPEKKHSHTKISWNQVRKSFVLVYWMIEFFYEWHVLQKPFSFYNKTENNINHVDRSIIDADYRCSMLFFSSSVKPFGTRLASRINARIRSKHWAWFNNRWRVSSEKMMK